LDVSVDSVKFQIVHILFCMMAPKYGLNNAV